MAGEHPGKAESVALGAGMQPEVYDERGVDLTLLRALLQLTPLERLQHMEKHARDIRTLMAYGKRHRETPPR